MSSNESFDIEKGIAQLSPQKQEIYMPCLVAKRSSATIQQQANLNIDIICPQPQPLLRSCMMCDNFVSVPYKSDRLCSIDCYNLRGIPIDSSDDES